MDTIATIADFNVIPLADAGSRQILFSEPRDKSYTPVSTDWLMRRAAMQEPVTANVMPSAIVGNWTRLCRANLSGGLYSRIMQIARRQDGWRGVGSKELTPGALKAWLDFWIAVQDNAVEPGLALTARGTLQTEWFRNSRRHLDLEFVSKERIFFGFFNGGAIYEGVDTGGALVPWLGGHHARPLQWRPS
jgi:hypothetical protein